MKKNIFSIIILGLALSSCSGVKNLAKPDVEMPTAYSDNRSDSICQADIDWIEFYTDPLLVTIIKKALEHNKDIKIAASRMEELRLLYGIDKLNYLPSVSAVAGITNEPNDYYDGNFKRSREISL